VSERVRAQNRKGRDSTNSTVLSVISGVRN
jgi:hypothetical protein